MHAHAEQRAMAGSGFGTRAQIDVAGDLAGRPERQPQAAPARLSDRDLQPLDEAEAQARRHARLLARQRLEQGRAVGAVVAQVVVQVEEEGRQVGFMGRADRESGCADGVLHAL